MSDESDLNSVSNQGQGPAFEPQSAADQRAHDDIVRVLSEFEHGLESLKTLHQQRSELQARLLERETELARQSNQLQERDQRLMEQQHDFEEASARFTQQLRDLEAAREAHARREQELQSRAAELESSLQATQASGHASSQSLDAARTELTDLASRLATARAEAASLIEHASALSTDLAGTRLLAQEFEQLWHVERHASAGLITALDHAINHARGLEHARDEGAAQSKQLETQRQETAELERVLAQLQERFKSELSNQKAALAKAEEAARAAGDRATELTSKLAAAQAEAARLTTQRARPAPTGSRSNESRRRRLKAYRAALRDHSKRLKKGAEALAKRFEQVETASKARAELASVRDRVIAADRALQRQRARGRTAVTLLAIVGTITILGALSWAVSRQVAPATFIAEAMIKADGRGRELNDAELEEWVRFHQDTLSDPRFQEEAAQRFARVGRADLGNAAAVAKLITSEVTTDSIIPGELKLQLRHQGRDEARRTLEGLTAALASYANAAQQRRIDGGATIVPSPAAANGEPVDNTQTYYALGFLGAGLAVAGVLGGAIFRKLASAKSAFEQDAQLASVLDEARWADATRG